MFASTRLLHASMRVAYLREHRQPSVSATLDMKAFYEASLQKAKFSGQRKTHGHLCALLFAPGKLDPRPVAHPYPRPHSRLLVDVHLLARTLAYLTEHQRLASARRLCFRLALGTTTAKSGKASSSRAAYCINFPAKESMALSNDLPKLHSSLRSMSSHLLHLDRARKASKPTSKHLPHRISRTTVFQ